MSAPEYTVIRVPFSTLLAITLIYVVISTFHLISHLILSFLLILFISLAINPIILILRRLKGGRKLATAIVVGMFLSIVILTTMMFYNPIDRSADKFISQLPEYWERVQHPLVSLERQAVISEEKVIEKIEKESGHVSNHSGQENSEKHGRIFHSAIDSILGLVGNGFKTLLANTASNIIILITVFFGVIFMSLNPKPIISAFFSLVPEKHHDIALIIVRRIVMFIPQWALATVVGMLVIGLMVFMVMLPVFGFQDALALGLIATMLEVIPYVGPIISGLPALLLAVGEGGWTPVIVIISYLSIQLLEHNVIAAVIVGGRLRLHPVVAVFSVLICYTAFGILGVLIAVPVAGIIRIIHEEIYRKRFLPHVSEKKLDSMSQIALESAQYLDDTNVPQSRSKTP